MYIYTYNLITYNQYKTIYLLYASLNKHTISHFLHWNLCCYIYYFSLQVQTQYYNFTDVKEREQVKRKKHTKQKIAFEEQQIEDTASEEQVITLKTMKSKEKQEHYDEDETGELENDEIPYLTTIATDISENKVEIVPASQVTHMLSDKSITDVTANLKFDTNYSLIADIQEVHEKESQLQIKENPKLTIKPSLNEIEPLVVTEVEISSSVDDYQVNKITTENIANKGIVPSESLITTETLANMSTSDFKKEEKQAENAKTSMILKDALNVSEEIISMDESPLHESPTKKSNATIAFSPLVGLNVLEINEEMKESDVGTLNVEKSATSKLNFNLLESIQVGEVFVEDKSGKYYPELIVPTEMARKDVLVSNQVVTEVHDVQEQEGILSALKLPPAQEASVDIASKDSLVISIEELHEKEGEFPAKEMPAQVSVSKDIMLHTGLHNTVTTSHIKESEFLADTIVLKNASVGISELQHTFESETNVHDSETSLEETRSIPGSHADIAISTLDKNVVHEVNVHESEKDLVLRDDKLTAKADFDFKAFEPLITSETLEMTATDDIKSSEKPLEDSAIETVITSSAKIVSYPLIHDKESTEEYRSMKPEVVLSSLIPNLPLTVSETESSECENKLTLNKIPETVHAQSASSHPLKTPLSEEVNTSDQIDFIAEQPNLSENASETRDLQKEITVLQTNVEDQLSLLQENKISQSAAQAVFIGKESLNITEVVTSLNEQSLDADKPKPSTFAKVDIDSDHKLAVVSEVNSRDTLSSLDTLTPNYEEAQITANNLISLQISQNETLDSQSVLQNDIQPDLKFINAEIVPTEESLKVTEILQHEKESDYNITTVPQTFTASTDITGHPVAVLSEVTVDSSVGYTDDSAKDASKKATIQNIAHNEIIVSTTNYNEKENELDTTVKMNTVSASINIDSNQAIQIEENRTEIAPEVLDSMNKLIWANAKQESTVTEAISQEEIMIHSSEEKLVQKEADNLTKPIISLSTLQAPQYNEKLAIEQENILSADKIPDNQQAELSIICQQSLETSEVISHSDNTEDTDAIKMDFKKAIPKVDEIYGKTAHTEEIITSEIPEEFKDEKVVLQNTSVTPIFKNTFEQMEIILGESETLLHEQPLTTSTISGDITETEAVITSYTETIDKEKEFDADILQPKQDASIGYVPYSSSIDTEVIISSNVEDFEKTTVKTSKASLTRDDLQKHIHRTEILVGEKETSLIDTKTDSYKATENIIETTAKEITEIQTVEKENALSQLPEPFSTTAHSSISEKQSILSTEVLASQDVENFQTPENTTTSATTTHGVQEAIEEIQPFICETEEAYEKAVLAERKPTGIIEEQKSVDITETIVTESEKVLETMTPIKSETVNLSFQAKNYVNITQITSSDKEEDFQTKGLIPETRTIKPTVDMPVHASIGVNETITSEKEVILESFSQTKPLHVGVSIEPKDSLNISENILAEKEETLKEDKKPKAVKNDVSLTTHKHLNTELLEVSEIEENMDLINNKKTEMGDITIEAIKPIHIQETNYEERPTELKALEKVKEHVPSVNLEVGQHLTVTEVEITETENLMDTKEMASLKQVEETYITNLPIQIEEITLKESEATLSQDKAPLQEVPGIIIEPKQHITITDTVGEEKEKDMPLGIAPISGKQKVDIKPINHITTTETVLMEEFETLKDNITKDEKALAKQDTFSELINIQPHSMETIKSIDVKFEPTESEIRYELELHKSYTTSENLVHEISDEIMSREENYKTAEKSVTEMKSIQQFEIIADEEPKSFDMPNEQKLEKADESHITLQEISNVKPDIVEKIEDLPSFLKPDINTASLDVEAHKSYIVTENVTEEKPWDMTVTNESIKEVTEQLLEMKPIEQTEIVFDENISSIKPLDHEEIIVRGKHIEMRPITQSSVVVNESEISSNFEQLAPLEKASVTLNTTESITVAEITQEDSQDTFRTDQVKSAKAEKSITLLTHVQCTENVAETQVKDLITPKTQTETTKITATSVTPLIITDSGSLQHETELHIPETKSQKIRKSFTVANEVEVSTEFVDEQALPYSEKKPRLSESKIIMTDEDQHRILITEQESQVHGKFNFRFNYLVIFVVLLTIPRECISLYTSWRKISVVIKMLKVTNRLKKTLDNILCKME